MLSKMNNKEYYSSLTGLWYTVWWQDNSENTPAAYRPRSAHWEDWTRVIPVRGEYSSGDPAIIREHLQLFADNGIDFILLDDTNSHAGDFGSIAYNIDQIFKTASEMDNAPQIAVALGGTLNSPEQAGTIEQRNLEADIIYEKYVKGYPKQYFLWKGKPLLVSYGLPQYFRWDDDRFTVRYATGNVNEGIVSGYVPKTGLWGWVFNSQTDNDEVYGVIPGFNKGPIQGDSPEKMMDQIKREQGNYYMKNWLAAIKADREVIMITSWNDFAEEPAIEAALPRNDADIDISVKRIGYPMDLRHERDKGNGRDRHNIWLDYYGDPAPFWYEELTWSYLALKNGLRENCFYKEENKDNVYLYSSRRLHEQFQMPHGHPIITIPDGYFGWFFDLVRQPQVR